MWFGGGGRRTAVSVQQSAIRGRRTAVSVQQSAIRGQRTRNLEHEIRELEVRGQRSEDMKGLWIKSQNNEKPKTRKNKTTKRQITKQRKYIKN